ncbi:MAG: peptidase dimerization domain-containing protein, partial [Chloroflexota bacterium]
GLPHEGVDPIVAGAQIVSALQTIVSRNLSPFDSGVVSVTTFQGGSAFNIISQHVELKGTIRTFSPEARERILGRLKNIVTGIATSMECEVIIEIDNVTPPVVNDADVCLSVKSTVEKILPQDSLREDFVSTVAEDMAYIMADIPSCYFFVGSKNEDAGLIYGHHHPRFDFDEQAMPRAAALIVGAAVDLLSAD